MKRFSFFLSFVCMLSLSQAVNADMLSVTVGGPLAYKTYQNSKNVCTNSPLEGTLSAASQNIQKYMTGYAQWHDENRKLSTIAIISGTIAVKSAIGAVAGAIDGLTITEGACAPFVLEIAMVGAGVGALRAIVSEIQGAAVNELGGAQIEAIVKYAATYIAPSLIKLDRALNERDAIILGSFIVAGSLSSTQLGSFAKSMRWLDPSKIISGVIRPSPSSLIHDLQSASKGKFKASFYGVAQDATFATPQPTQNEHQSILEKLWRSGKEFFTKHADMFAEAQFDAEVPSAFFTWAQQKMGTAAQSERPFYDAYFNLDKISNTAYADLYQQFKQETSLKFDPMPQLTFTKTEPAQEPHPFYEKLAKNSAEFFKKTESSQFPQPGDLDGQVPSAFFTWAQQKMATAAQSECPFYGELLKHKDAYFNPNKITDTPYANLYQQFKQETALKFDSTARASSFSQDNIPLIIPPTLDKTSYFQEIMKRAENWHLPDSAVALMNPFAHMSDHESFQWSNLANAFPNDLANHYQAGPAFQPIQQLPWQQFNNYQPMNVQKPDFSYQAYQARQARQNH